MLSIRKIKYKNILSSGNQFSEIDFNSTKTTLIRGNSGQGKSLIITALIFGLYGKSNRGTTKKQLVNTVNKKDCLVEVEFSNDGKDFKIRRGISPNIFEIYINNKLQEELSAVKDQQKYLEQNILKMSFKTFMQVVVLGSNNYVPFMQLSTADRRDLVEEILDIKIFSVMNSLIKEKIKSVDRKLKDIELLRNSIEEKIIMQKGFIDKIKNDGENLIQQKLEDISNFTLDNTNCNSKIEILLNDLEKYQEEISNISFSAKKLKGLLGLDGKVEQRKNLIQEEKEFFETHSTCPTCKQDLTVEFKVNKLNEISNTYDELTKNHQELINAIKQEEQKENQLLTINSKINSVTLEIKNLKNKISVNNKSIGNLNTEIENIRGKIDNQNEDIKTLSNLKKDKTKLTKDYNQCKEALHYFEFSHLLIKDGGIKSKIIHKYIPLINTQINKYLQMMDLYVNFTLDDEFKETINTPIHEGFSYSSFSEGEKQRINLATILAWREISRIKNSANCNLIFFDETLDSSLDASGIDDFLKIINYIVEDANIFVISHREGFDDRFSRVLEVKKVNGFSKVFT